MRIYHRVCCSRARREAALVLRCSEEFIRVEEVVSALTSLELA